MLVHRTTTEGIKGAGTLPPLFVITDTDHGGYVCVVLYSILILMLLLVATRIYTRYYVLKLFRIDDYFLILAAVRLLRSSFFAFAEANFDVSAAPWNTAKRLCAASCESWAGARQSYCL